MQPLDLNLASRPFKNNALLWGAYGLAAFLFVVLTVWNVRTHQKYSVYLSDLKGRVVNTAQDYEDLGRKELRADGAIRKYDLGLLDGQAEKANEVIKWKTFSWTRLFNQLQDVQPWNVQMVSIRPVFRGEARDPAMRELEGDDAVTVTLEGIARTIEDFFELERALLDDPHFARINPLGLGTDDTTGETLFRVRALYLPRVVEDQEALAVEEAAEAEGQPGETEGLPAATGSVTAGEGAAAEAGAEAAASPPPGSGDTDPPAEKPKRPRPPRSKPVAPAAGDRIESGEEKS